jgi:hypothetical protein
MLGRSNKEHFPAIKSISLTFPAEQYWAQVREMVCVRSIGLKLISSLIVTRLHKAYVLDKAISKS